MRTCAALLTIAALLAPPHRVQAVTAVANITISTGGLTFNAIDSTQQFMSSAPISIGGQIRTKAHGTGDIQMLSPSNITGSSGGLLRISYFSMTCGGAAQPGQAFVANKTPLIASSSVPCATFGSDFNSSILPGGQLNFLMSLFLDDRTLDNDSYPATNFSIVATAT